MEEVFVIVAKAPIEGFAKTRLAKEVGDEAAIKLYKSFMQDFFKSLNEKHPNKKKYLYITPFDDQALQFFQNLSQETKCPFDCIEAQGEGGLFERIQNIFKTIHAKSPSYIHLTGTDIPDFPFDVISSEVDKDEITIGPDFDGGYYYIGASSASDFIFDLKGEIKSEEVFDKTVNVAKEKNTAYKVVKTWSDIDCLDDFYESINRDRLELLKNTRKIAKTIDKIDIPSF